MTQLALYLTYFTIYSVAGWAGDTLYTRLHEGHWCSRGFMRGPFYMLYGYGALAAILVFDPRSPWWAVVIFGYVISSVIEYVGHWTMERIGILYWDYSPNFLNLNGRICLESITIFVLGMIGVVYIIQPVLADVVALAPVPVIWAVGFGSAAYLFGWGAVRVGRQLEFYRRTGELSTQAWDFSDREVLEYHEAIEPALRTK